MQRGFTLIELMIIVAIVGILAAVLIPAVQGKRPGAETVPTVGVTQPCAR